MWELAEGRSVYVVEEPDHAGHSVLLLFVDDLDTLVAQVAAAGIEPSRTEAYGDGVCKVVFTDPDGNEVGFGGAPAS